MKPRRTFNPKRRIRPAPESDELKRILETLANKASYGGNPEHKKNPGDFGLSPPTIPRQYKSYCDDAGVLSKAEAQRLLREGMRKGLVSVRESNGWPQNVWAMTNDGIPLEAMLENPVKGIYHGYPMPEEDPLANEVRKRWGSAR